MALSLPGERSLAAASPVQPLVAILRWFAQARAARTRRAGLQDMLELDPSRLRDLGVSRADIEAAMVGTGLSGPTLHAARRRNAQL